MSYDPYSTGVVVKFDDGDISMERSAVHPAAVTSYRNTHTVLEGETIQSIAFKYYGDSGRWMDICDVNSIYDPFEELKPGMEIYIP